MEGEWQVVWILGAVVAIQWMIAEQVLVVNELGVLKIVS
jgi:hypothetical protein